MKKITYFYLTFILLFILQSCEHDNFESDLDSVLLPGDIATTTFIRENLGTSIRTDFIGIVTDQYGNKLSGASIVEFIKNVDNFSRFPSTIGVTDINGVFITKYTHALENFGYITASKEGYIQGSRVVIPNNDINIVKIVLLKKEIKNVVYTGEPSKVSLNNGTSIEFDGNFKSRINNFNGLVAIFMNYIAPNTKEAFNKMPGSLLARTNLYEPRLINSYGMVNVTLSDPDQVIPLDIAESSTVNIEIPIDPTQIEIAPERINSWYFSEFYGYWIEGGYFTKKGNNYIGEVKKVNCWWNIGLPTEFINFNFRVFQTINEQPDNVTSLFYTEIRKTSNNELIFSGDLLGGSEETHTKIRIPKNEEIKISIYSTSKSCNNILLHEETLGSFNIETIKEISFPQSQNTFTTLISGSLNNCFDGDITKGYLFIDDQKIINVSNGRINLNIQHCTNETIDLTLYDFGNKVKSETFDLQLNETDVDLGDQLSACDNSNIYRGDVSLNSQAEVDSFTEGQYNKIFGDLFIDGNDIVDISKLSTLESVSGNFSIKNNNNLQSIEGLENIVSIGNDLDIVNNNALTTISEENFSNLIDVRISINVDNNSNLNIVNFKALKTLCVLSIENNPNLQRFTANNLKNISHRFTFQNNALMMDLGEFNNLDEINNVFINNNESLVSLKIFTALTIVDQIEITNNSSLLDLTSLNNLIIATSIEIQNNQNLISLSGLNNLKFIEDYLFVTDNEKLTNLCALQNLFTNGTINGKIDVTNGAVTRVLNISNNAFNPSFQNLIDGNCSL